MHPGSVDIGLLALVVHLAGHLVQHLGVVEFAAELVEQVDVALHVGVVRVQLLGIVGVVPQVGAADLGFEFDEAHPVGADLQVAVGLAEAAAQIA